jgi:ATP-dependent Clp protease ATP-binding subunit ClpA
MSFSAAYFLDSNQNSLAMVLVIIIFIGLLGWFFYWQKRKANSPYLDLEVKDVAKAATELKAKYEYKELLPEHLLWALFDQPGHELNHFLYQHKLDPLEGKKVLEEMFANKHVNKGQTLVDQPYVSKHVKEIINQAGINKVRRKVRKVTPIDLFEALLEALVSSDESIFDETKSFMKLVGVSSESMLKQLRNNLEINKTTNGSQNI